MITAPTPNNDNIDGTKGNDSFQGNGGDDRLKGGQGDDRIKGGKGDDFISGGQGNDFLSGGQGDDVIMGGAGNDVVLGGQGDDVLFGGQPGTPGTLEKDILSGGDGRDRFVLYDSDADRTFYTGFGDADYADILDFTAEDKLVLGAGESYSFSQNGNNAEIFSNGDLVAVIRNADTTLVQSRIDYVA
jgi:Ca2+-binding RTX toxin-like protein